jgi:hypothetical protein
MKRKYPTGMFWFFVLTNLVFHFFYLFVPGVVLCVVGIWVKACLQIGLAILLLDLVLSIVEQLRIRRAAITSTHPDVIKLMDLMNGPDGLHGVKKWADERITESTPVNTDEENT